MGGPNANLRIDPDVDNRGEYVLGTDRAELERLGLQHRLWADAAHTLWLRAGFGPGSRILDIGCGPGFAALDLAELVSAAFAGLTPGRVVGIDESQPYLDHLQRQAAAQGVTSVQTVRGNVVDLEQLDAIGSGAYDGAFARWVFCFVRDPAAVIRGVRRALRTGGRIAIQDYFNYECMTTAPRLDSFTKAVRATGASWRSRGGNPDVVGRLPAMLIDAGFEIVHFDINQRIARPGEPMWQWPETFWKNFLPKLVELGQLTPGDQQHWLDDWARLTATPGAFIVLPPVFDIVAEKR